MVEVFQVVICFPTLMFAAYTYSLNMHKSLTCVPLEQGNTNWGCQQGVSSGWPTLHYATLHYTTLHYTTLHYTTLHYTKLHYTTLHYTTLHYTTLQDSSISPAEHSDTQIEATLCSLLTIDIVPLNLDRLLEREGTRNWSSRLQEHNRSRSSFI